MLYLMFKLCLFIFLEELDTQSKEDNKYSIIEYATKMLMKRRCQEEQAMALDFSRQSKVCIHTPTKGTCVCGGGGGGGG